jgi:cytochrome c oxidase subunit 2
MRRINRRLVLQGALASTGVALVHAAFAQAAAEPRVIEMTARRFQYEPNEIPLKAGERVVVVIKSVDFTHGMNIPDLKQRLDLVPGKVTRLELHPLAPGEIEFVCDNFCGDGHEQMHGKFVVSA